MHRVINNIVIVGGGSSGWLAAAHLTNNLPPNVKVTLIESSKLGTIGVGEGTQPFTMNFLRECGLKAQDWMPSADAVYKLGVLLEGWSDLPIFVDNDTQEMNVLGPGVMMHDYILNEGISKEDFLNWIPSYRMSMENKSPKCSLPNLDFTSGYTTDPWDAVHFRADLIVDTLKNKCKSKLRYIDDLITEVTTDSNGVTGLVTENNGTITADLYIDCSGFKSMLLEGALNEPFISFESKLLCNRAVALPTQYKNKQEEMRPYTRAIAMPAGWRWQIATFSRIGNGYVYCDKFITPEEAEQALREAVGDFETPANHIKMKTGTHKNIALKNVYAVGLAAAFAEPLEATGITFTTNAIQNLTKVLLANNGNYNDEAAQWLSNEYNEQVLEIADFIFLHYHLAKKNDTDFWKAVHEVPMPRSAKAVLDFFVPNPPNVLYKKGMFSMFHSGQWFELLYLSGAYDTVTGHKSLPKPVSQYGKIIWDMYKMRTDAQLEVFPNHADYLEWWYKQ